LTGCEWIEGAALETLLPHRGVNLLIDAVRTSGSGASSSGQSRLAVGPDMGLGRGIFLREGESGPVVIEPALAEHLALNAICVLAPDMAKGEIAFFSLISDFEFLQEARAGAPLFAEVRRLRDKGRFRRFEGELKLPDGAPVARGEIMAYTADPSSAERRETAKLLVPPRVREARPVDARLFWWKRPEMIFVDERVDASDDLSAATYRYTYPPDHPFCPGHFPGNPVMMGIAQWIAAADAAYALALDRAAARGASTLESGLAVDADIVRESGSPIAEVRQLVVAAGGPRERPAPLRLERTRRVGFRDQVRPGETIYIRVQVSPA